jgi:hypothetical protein
VVQDRLKTKKLRQIAILELSDSDSEPPPPHTPTEASDQGPDENGEYKERTVISHGGFDDWLNDGSILVLWGCSILFAMSPIYIFVRDEPPGAQRPKKMAKKGSEFKLFKLFKLMLLTYPSSKAFKGIREGWTRYTRPPDSRQGFSRQYCISV